MILFTLMGSIPEQSRPQEIRSVLPGTQERVTTKQTDDVSDGRLSTGDVSPHGQSPSSDVFDTNGLDTRTQRGPSTMRRGPSLSKEGVVLALTKIPPLLTPHRLLPIHLTQHLNQGILVIKDLSK